MSLSSCAEWYRSGTTNASARFRRHYRAPKEPASIAQILIFEDDADFAAVLRLGLEARGHSVVITDKGEEAFTLLSGGGFDLAVVDMFIYRDGQVVPDGGLLLLGRLTTHWRAGPGRNQPKIPMIAMSGGFGNRMLGEIDHYAQSYGADAVLTKPFTTQEFRAVVDRLLGAAD